MNYSDHKYHMALRNTLVNWQDMNENMFIQSVIIRFYDPRLLTGKDTLNFF